MFAPEGARTRRAGGVAARGGRRRRVPKDAGAREPEAAVGSACRPAPTSCGSASPVHDITETNRAHAPAARRSLLHQRSFGGLYATPSARSSTLLHLSFSVEVAIAVAH